MFKNINAVIIDLDGTMLDTAPDFLVAINRMRNDFP
jgi:phosphoglycolate phosphatase